MLEFSTDENQMLFLDDPTQIRFVQNPSQVIQSCVLIRCVRNFFYINNPSWKSQEIFIKYIQARKTIQRDDYRYYINHKNKYNPLFLKLCYDATNIEEEKNYILAHPNYIQDTAKLILHEMTKKQESV